MECWGNLTQQQQQQLILVPRQVHYSLTPLVTFLIGFVHPFQCQPLSFSFFFFFLHLVWVKCLGSVLTLFVRHAPKCCACHFGFIGIRVAPSANPWRPWIKLSANMLYSTGIAGGKRQMLHHSGDDAMQSLTNANNPSVHRTLCRPDSKYSHKAFFQMLIFLFFLPPPWNMIGFFMVCILIIRLDLELYVCHWLCW